MSIVNSFLAIPIPIGSPIVVENVADPRTDRQISERTLLAYLKKILKQLSLTGRLHTFKHSFVTHAVIDCGIERDGQRSSTTCSTTRRSEMTRRAQRKGRQPVRATALFVSGGHGTRTRNRLPGTSFPVRPLAIRLPSGIVHNQLIFTTPSLA